MSALRWSCARSVSRITKRDRRTRKVFNRANCAPFSAESIAMCYVSEGTTVIVNILLLARCLGFIEQDRALSNILLQLSIGRAEGVANR